MLSRRKFITTGIALTGATSIAASLAGCSVAPQIKGSLSGPDAALGHRLRQGNFGTPAVTAKHDVVIIGGGISGLAAARRLSKASVDYVLLELEKKAGGNSSSGSNSVSSYPLGAHYLPVPGMHDHELIRFLEEAKVITGYENGKPVYDDYFLCFDPKERLYINEHWQEGLVPHEGIPSEDASEIIRFHELITHYRTLHGADGKEVFCIPLAACSEDPEYRKLDRITFHQFLTDLNFKSAYLMWYVNYCCRDDYGATTSTTSAWAGLHYFTSRKGIIANAPADTVLTWPQGNGWLVSKLKEQSTGSVLTQSLAYAVNIIDGAVHVDYLDANENRTKRIIAGKVIVASPQFIAQHLLSPQVNRHVDYAAFNYAPWMIANLTMAGNFNDKRGESLCWDNVIYGSNSLGYVDAGHQLLNQHIDKRVLTYYMPLTGAEPKDERQRAHGKGYESWQQLVLADLKSPHPHFAEQLEAMDIWIWGHGMIRPSVGFVTGANAANAKSPVDNRIFFAHSDLSGISIFEEAFYQGTLAAEKLIAS